MLPGEAVLVVKRHRWQILTLFLLVVAGLAVLYLNPFRLGLDLQGGVHVVLQAVPGGDAVTDEAMAGALAVVERRVNGLGVVEPVIQREGRDRIIVELPGLQDAHEAIRVIGQTAQLEIQDPFGQTVLTGADLADAHLGRDELGRPAVDVTFTEEGARKFAQLTTLWQGYQIPHLLDGELLVAPVVQEPITQGRGIITGNFTLEEARHLAIQLKSGALPVPLEPVEVRHVGPSLGADSLRSSWQAGIISGVLVILFMIAFYRVAGAVAGFCLLLYLLLDLAALVLLGATFTLPGLAGIILSIGMAVDANVIIFERIKEELRAGKRARAAVRAGFTRAFRAILDANVTTLIVAAVLFFSTTGPVQGFAVTLSIGILISMFTAIVATRWILELITDRNPHWLSGTTAARGLVK